MTEECQCERAHIRADTSQDLPSVTVMCAMNDYSFFGMKGNSSR